MLVVCKLFCSPLSLVRYYALPAWGGYVSRENIRYDSVYLTCSKKLTGSQLCLPHGTNKKLKCKTKNKMMSVIGPVQSRYHEAVQ